MAPWANMSLPPKWYLDHFSCFFQGSPSWSSHTRTDKLCNINISVATARINALHLTRVKIIWYDYIIIVSGIASSDRAYGYWYRFCSMSHLSVRLSGVLWKNGWLDLDAIWGGESVGCKDEVSSWDWRLPHGNGQFCGWMWGVHCNQWGTLWCTCAKVHEPIKLPFGVVSG